MLTNKRKVYYLAKMSNKDEISIDQEEMKLVAKMIDNGQKIIKCKEGIINVAYLVDIVLDDEVNSQISKELEHSGYYEDKFYTLGEDSFDKVLGGGNNKELSNGK